MGMNTSTKLPYLIIAAGVGAIGGALSILLARKESREYIRERSAKGLEYLNQAGAKLQKGTEELVEKGREIITGYCGTTHESASNQENKPPEMH